MGKAKALSIALVCPYDLAIPGGVQTQVIGLADELASRADDVAEVTVVAPGSPHAYGAHGYTFVTAGRSVPVPANGSRAPVALWPSAWSRTSRALRTGRFDVTHVHEPMAPLVGLAGVRASRAPVVATFHRAGLDGLYRLEVRLLRHIPRRFAATVAVSEAALATAENALKVTIDAVIPNGVVVPVEAPAPKADVPTIAFIGRHEERKGLGVLLEAFQSLPAETVLEIAGEGPETRQLRGLHGADSRIRWRGPIDDEAKPAFLARAHLFCAPSVGGESFGVVLLEAMAMGTAVVASDLDGYRRAAGDAAEFVPAGDAAALAATLERLLADKGAQVALAARGRARVAGFSLATAADRYLELYRSVVRS